MRRRWFVWGILAGVVGLAGVVAGILWLTEPAGIAAWKEDYD